MSLLLLLWGLLSIPPAQAAHVAGAALDVDGDRLRAICLRESRCQPVGVHEGDAWLGARAWQRASSRGALPQWCPWYRDRGEARRWATRGSWGLVAAYSIHELGCWPPELLDVPIVGAFAAAVRLRKVQDGRALPATDRWAGT